MIIKRSLYSIYDDTDSIKRMKDSDILAAKPKKQEGYGGVLGTAATGAVVGATAGALGKSMLGKSATFGKRFVKGGKYGAVIGGTIGAIVGANRRNKFNKENEFYNNRLEQAQRWAKRREKIDWKQNMTGREGYSY